MSLWEEARGGERLRRYEGEIYRLVEGQHFIATRKLVDSDEEQALLERVLDRSKPPAPTRNARGALHYLLYTPFRYPPLKAGARFHSRLEQSLFYGSEELETAMAEVAHGRFVFAAHSGAALKPMTVPYTHFVVKVASPRAILLTQPPFDRFRARISAPDSHAESQALGAAMRRAGVELFTYFSARRPRGVNVGLFTVEAFAANKPAAGKDRHWEVYISEGSVEFQRPRRAAWEREARVFRREDFDDFGKTLEKERS